jgi:hypothetical protein
LLTGFEQNFVDYAFKNAFLGPGNDFQSSRGPVRSVSVICRLRVSGNALQVLEVDF